MKENPPELASYLPQLDGLRVCAFFAVFIHHLPPPPDAIPLRFVHERGWMGVDLFFVISAFLFFHLFREEARIAGTIDISKFYLRRVLRLYPLMIAFPAGVMLATQTFSREAMAQIVGIATFVDNFAVWLRGYKVPIPFTAHLWTLSFEFQIYAVIPLAFLIYKYVGERAFFKLLACVWLACIGARLILLLMGAPYLIVWVTPFLRPESVLAGIVVLICVKQLRPAGVFFMAMLAVLILAAMPSLPAGRWAMLIYPTVALLGGACLCLSLKIAVVSKLLSRPTLVYLGTISFGLYVFHVLGIAIAMKIGSRLMVTFEPSASASDYAILLVSSLLITVLAAAISYHSFEIFFLRLKTRITIVHSRSG